MLDMGFIILVKKIKIFIDGQIVKEFLREVSDFVPHDNKNFISKY
jgi:hypothetical protein